MTLHNETSSTRQLTVIRNNGQSYGTEIPAGGSWTPPADVIAVLVNS